MDLPQIGAHCHSCHILDFLPIKCPACEHTYCRAHIPLSSHTCASSSTSAMPASAPRPPKSSLEGRCQVESCINKRMTTWNLMNASPAVRQGDMDQGASLTMKGDEVVCGRCKGSFCLSHRNPSTHSCNPPPPTVTAAKAHTQTLIASLNPPSSASRSSKPSSTTSTSTPSSAATSSSSPSSSFPKPPAPKRKKPNPTIELMRLKQFAKPGPRGEIHERNLRWHLRIGVDVSPEAERVKRRIKGIGEGEEIKDGTYWRKDITVGQVVQSLVMSHGIRYEPVAGDPFTLIHLLHISPSSLSTLSLLLDPSSQISACVEDGAEVWVARGDRWRDALTSS